MELARARRFQFVAACRRPAACAAAVAAAAFCIRPATAAAFCIRLTTAARALNSAPPPLSPPHVETCEGGAGEQSLDKPSTT